MTTGVLLTLRGGLEQQLVTAIATAPGLSVVRRCADTPELLAAALAGLGTIAVVDTEVRLDRALLARLLRAGTHTLVLCLAADVPRLREIGAIPLALTTPAEDVGRVLQALAAIAEGNIEAVSPRETAPAAGPVGPVGAPPADGRAWDPPDGGAGVSEATAPAAGGTGEPGGTGARAAAPLTRRRLRADRAASPPSAADPGHTGADRTGQAAVRDVASANSSSTPGEPGSPAPGTAWTEAAPAEGTAATGAWDPPAGPPPAPRVITVWGPHGSPGRTTIAINLAAELAALGAPTLLVDADIWGSAVAPMLGMLDATAGLSAAVRAADHGNLDAAALERLSPHVSPQLRVLPGLARPQRWREISGPSVDSVWERGRQMCSWIVVDAPVLVPDEEPGGFDMMLGPHRNAVATSAIEAADHLVVVGAAEPIGIERLVQSLLDLDEGVKRPAGAGRTVVVNRVRASAAGPRPSDSVREALSRFAGVLDPVVVPDDRPGCDRALLAGTAWREVVPRSAAREPIRQLARTLAAEAGHAPAPVRDTRRLLPGVRLPSRKAPKPAPRAAAVRADPATARAGD